jgi:hypothetical protein
MLKIEFITSEFELSHGRRPRGQGTWAFSERRIPKVIEDYIWTPYMSYVDAKKWLVNKLKSEGVTGYFEVYVCP